MLGLLFEDLQIIYFVENTSSPLASVNIDSYSERFQIIQHLSVVVMHKTSGIYNPLYPARKGALPRLYESASPFLRNITGHTSHCDITYLCRAKGCSDLEHNIMCGISSACVVHVQP